ncbi:nickel-dependent hydrogenase large subunit, partial [Zavarzinia sp.]|uniref:nickel-dependent hydrogenase large subunit n=1 Tax=Zavarzinia sp. TaxID=2027920 RepID=UPI003BB5F8AF
FTGRSPAATAALVPLVFNLCATAQERASRGALGLPGGGGEAALRQEHLRDHAFCLGVTWPSLMGAGPDNELLSRVADHGAGRNPAATAAALRHHLLGDTMDVGALTPPLIDRLLAGGATAFLRLLAAVRGRLRPDWGRAALSAPSPADISDHLAGRPVPLRETTARDAVAGYPLLLALEAREGRSLFARMVARLLDFLRVLDPAAVFAPALSPAPGIGIAMAVRGFVGHFAELRDDRVAAYRLVTPTDWNTAPGGILAQVLAALPAAGDLPFLARLAVSCVNPCVPTTIAVDGARFDAHA